MPTTCSFDHCHREWAANGDRAIWKQYLARSAFRPRGHRGRSRCGLSSNGQLEPAAFTDSNGASATIQRIEWASDTVKLKVSPHTGLAGHKLDFIELDGSVSLDSRLVVDTRRAGGCGGRQRTLSWASGGLRLAGRGRTGDTTPNDGADLGIGAVAINFPTYRSGIDGSEIRIGAKGVGLMTSKTEWETP